MELPRSCSLLLAVNAARARLYLGDAAPEVAHFILSLQRDNGAFPGRHGQPDIYYTQFALQALAALEQPLPSTGRFLHDLFPLLPTLDLVHTLSLGICAALTNQWTQREKADLLQHVHSFQNKDRTWRTHQGQSHGSPYGQFLAVQALELLEQPPPAPPDFSRFHTAQGGFVNHPDTPNDPATATSTAAAVAALWTARRPCPISTAPWLQSLFSPQLGGFRVAPNIPVPDLLSTAVVLFALDLLDQDLTPFREQTLQFIEALWDDSGGFLGHPSDDQPDIEYSWYALLALGCLAQPLPADAPHSH